MKILMILSKSYVNDPRVSKEAESLIDNGHEVRVIVWDRRREYDKESIVKGVEVYRIHNTFFMNILPSDLFRNPPWWFYAYKKGLELYKEKFAKR